VLIQESKGNDLRWKMIMHHESSSVEIRPQGRRIHMAALQCGIKWVMRLRTMRRSKPGELRMKGHQIPDHSEGSSAANSRE
jgi:hypothetical protein